MGISLREILRRLSGKEKEHSLFSSEKEAYDFCRAAYNNSGGVTPELHRAYEFYMKNIGDDCGAEFRPETAKNIEYSG